MAEPAIPGDIGQLQQALDRTVLAVQAVENGNEAVDPCHDFLADAAQQAFSLLIMDQRAGTGGQV